MRPNLAIAPADRTDPEEVAAFVVTAWVNRGPTVEPFAAQTNDWITPELATSLNERQLPDLDEHPARGDIVAAKVSSGPAAATATITVERVVAKPDRTELRVLVIHATLNIAADGWRVASLEHMQ